MRIGYFPKINISPRRSNNSARKTQRLIIPGKVVATDQDTHLFLNQHTQSDLELFQSKTGTQSLFDLCNYTCTNGGHSRLRWRMEHPFCKASRILKTQKTIQFIIANRSVFKKIPFYLTSRLERYQKDPLRFVTHENWLEFTAGALNLKLFDPYHYRRVFRGVEYSAIYIRCLRDFLNQDVINDAEGELAILCQQLQELVYNSKMNDVPDGTLRASMFMKILRLDQAFRIYEKEKYLELLGILYEIDALISMADATKAHDYVMPKLSDLPTRIEGAGLHHPQVENAVANSISMDQRKRLLFLTGPNMAGKTTYLRAAATAVYLGQLGMGVPASSFEFTPVDSLFCSINVNDDIHSGTSYFLAEVQSMKAIATAIAAGGKVLAIMDEPFKGTNVKDALEASFAVLSRLETKEHCLFLISSHLIELDELFAAHASISRCHFEAIESGASLEFDYTLHQGVSSQRLGMRVLTEQSVLKLLDAEQHSPAG